MVLNFCYSIIKIIFLLYFKNKNIRKYSPTSNPFPNKIKFFFNTNKLDCIQLLKFKFLALLKRICLKKKS